LSGFLRQFKALAAETRRQSIADSQSSITHPSNLTVPGNRAPSPCLPVA
jgi:hypothetical protein